MARFVANHLSRSRIKLLSHFLLPLLSHTNLPLRYTSLKFNHFRCVTHPEQSLSPNFNNKKYHFLPPGNFSDDHQYSCDTSDFDSDGEEIVDSNESNMKQFLQLVSEARQSSSLEDAMEVLHQEEFQPSRVLIYSSLMNLRSSWKSAFLVFKWGENCVSDFVKVWKLMIWILCKNTKFDIAWRLVLQMHRHGVLTPGVFYIMMKRYAAVNDSRKAIRTFHAMEKFGMSKNSDAIYTLLRALCKNRSIEEAEEFIFLNQKLFPLETESFNIILNGWCNIVTDIVEAKRVWREMSNNCIHPDGTSYSHMISCLSKVGNLFDSLRLFDEMKKKGWSPGLSVYNSLIYVLTKENCMKNALKLVDKMLEVGLKPDSITYNSIIYPLCEAGNLSKAKDLLDDMLRKGINPTIGTYHSFVEAGTMEDSLHMIELMRADGVGPTDHTFLIILKKCLRLNEPDLALRIWSEIGKYNLLPGPIHYISLVQALIKSGRLSAAKKFYDEMRCRGFARDPKLEKILKETIRNHNNQQLSSLTSASVILASY